MYTNGEAVMGPGIIITADRLRESSLASTPARVVDGALSPVEPATAGENL